MHKKRFGVLLIIVVLSLLLIVSVVSAEQSNSVQEDKGAELQQFSVGENETLIFEREEITDLDLLLERAKKGINEGPGNPRATLTKDGKEISRSEKNLAKDDDKENKTFVTVQKVKQKKNLETGKVTTLYRQDAFAIIQGKTDTDAGTDPGSLSNIYLTAYNTIYWSAIQCDDLFWNYKFTLVRGRWVRKDSQVSWANSKIGYYQQGEKFTSSCVSKGMGYYQANVSMPSSGNPVSGTWYSLEPGTDYYVSWDFNDHFAFSDIDISYRGGSYSRYELSNWLFVD